MSPRGHFGHHLALHVIILCNILFSISSICCHFSSLLVQLRPLVFESPLPAEAPDLHFRSQHRERAQSKNTKHTVLHVECVYIHTTEEKRIKLSSCLKVLPSLSLRASRSRCRPTWSSCCASARRLGGCGASADGWRLV